MRTGSTVVNGVPRPDPPEPKPPKPPKPGIPPRPGREPAALVPRGDELTLTDSLPDGVQLELAVSRADEQQALSHLLLLEIVGSAAGLALATLALWRVLGVALSPLDAMTSLALRIARGRSGDRLGPTRTDTELGRLAGAFDEMLDAQDAALAASQRPERRTRRFLADASHELRSPITGIQATGETLLRDGADQHERERLVVALVREARRAGRLVGDLLDTTRAEDGLDLHRTAVDLSGLARDAVDREGRVDGTTTFTLDADAACEVWADADRSAQVVAALLDNARRASAGGTVVLEVRALSDAGRLTVHDDGPGVPAEQREHIFERFVRLDGGRARGQGGSGLGLAIARAIARAHDGTLDCAASPLGGAAFTLRLPARAAASTAAATFDAAPSW